MNGYTIENSIDLLEKDVKALKQGGGGGGATNWNQLQGKPFDTLGEEFHNLDGALTIQDISSDKIALPDSEHYNWENVSEAVEGMNEELGHINGDIIDLTTEVNSLDENKQDKLSDFSYSIENLVFTGCTYVSGGYFKLGNLVGVNIRVNLTNSSTFTISGFPTYNDHTISNKNTVIANCLQMSDSSSSNIYANLRPNGELWAPLSQTGREYGFSLVYICDEEGI